MENIVRLPSFILNGCVGSVGLEIVFFEKLYFSLVTRRGAI
jgi:hypothetical protein